MISRRFIKSSLIYSLIGSLPLVSGVILIPFFTSKLNTDQFGVNAIYFSLITLFQVIINYGIDMYIGVRYFDYKDNTEMLNKHIGNVFSVSLVYGLFIIALIVALGPGIFRFVFGSQLSLYPWGFFTVLTAFFNGIIKSYSSLLINQQRPATYFWINITNFALIVVTSLVLLERFPYTLNGPVLGRLIPSIITGLLVLAIVKLNYGFTIRKEFISKILLFTTPLVIYAILNWGFFNIDRFIIIKVFKNASYVGIFDIASKIALVLELLCAGLASAINPRVFTRWKEGKGNEDDRDIMKYYNGFLAIILLAIPLLVISAPILVHLFISKPVYYEATAYLMVLSLGFIPRMFLYMYITPLYYFNKTAYIPKAFFFAAIIQITMTYLMVQYFGLWGAAWSSFLSKLVVAYFIYLGSRKVYQFTINVKKQIYLPLTYIIMMLMIDQLISQNHNYLGYGISVILGSTLVFFVFRREIKILAKTLFKASEDSKSNLFVNP
jgi:O-antigen/teichoic acid export membrane protein